MTCGGNSNKSTSPHADALRHRLYPDTTRHNQTTMPGFVMRGPDGRELPQYSGVASRYIMLGVLQAVAGFSFIMFGSFLTPLTGMALYVLPDMCAPLSPRTHLVFTPPPHRAMIIVGSILLGGLLFGCFIVGPWFGGERCCKIFSALWSTALAIVQLIMALLMIIDLRKVLDSLGVSEDESLAELSIGRWLFLLLACGQLLLLVFIFKYDCRKK